MENEVNTLVKLTWFDKIFKPQVITLANGHSTIRRRSRAPLIVLLPAAAMLRASGVLDVTAELCAPLLRRAGLPPETAPLMLLRPISGSAALAVGMELMRAHGPDSRIGLITAVMLGSTETTFYTISVYFGAAKIRRTRYAVPAALIADLTGFLASALTVRLFFP